MKLSELIELLNRILEEEGDIPVKHQLGYEQTTEDLDASDVGVTRRDDEAYVDIG